MEEDELERNVWAEDLGLEQPRDHSIKYPSIPNSTVNQHAFRRRSSTNSDIANNLVESPKSLNLEEPEASIGTMPQQQEHSTQSELLLPQERAEEEITRIPSLSELLSVDQRISFVTLCYKVLFDLSQRYRAYEYIPAAKSQQDSKLTASPTPKRPSSSSNKISLSKKGDENVSLLLASHSDGEDDPAISNHPKTPLFEADFKRTTSQDFLNNPNGLKSKHSRVNTEPLSIENGRVSRSASSLEEELASEQTISDFIALSQHADISGKSYSNESLGKSAWKLDGNMNLAFAIKEYQSLTFSLLNALYSQLEISQDEILFVESSVKNEMVSVVSLINFLATTFAANSPEKSSETLRFIMINIGLLILQFRQYDSTARTFLRHLSMSIRYCQHTIDLADNVESLIFSNSTANDTFKNNDVYSALKSSGKQGQDLLEKENLTVNERTFLINKKKLDEKKKVKLQRRKVLMMTAAAVGGGALIGVTTGLAAPILGAGIAGIFTTLKLAGATAGASAFFSSVGGSALITGGGILTGTSYAGMKMSKRLKDVEIFRFIPICTDHEDSSVSLIISISGWITGKTATETAIKGRSRSNTESSIISAKSSAASDSDDKDKPRKPLDLEDPETIFKTGMQDLITPFLGVAKPNGTHYALSFDPHILKSLGESLKIFVSELISFSANQALAATFLSMILSGLTWPMWLLKLGYFVDNPFSLALDRARKAGLLLAESISSLKGSGRSVTLCGFSMGARVVYYCCLELAKMGIYGLVENVYMFGAPVLMTSLRTTSTKSPPKDTKNDQRNPKKLQELDEWRSIASIVSGRVVNGYSQSDWVLGFLFRASVAGMWDVAGLQPVLLGSDSDEPRLAEHYADGIYTPPETPSSTTKPTPAKISLIENIDITSKVSGHLNYRNAMPWLLRNVCGFSTWSDNLDTIEEVVGGDWLDEIDIITTADPAETDESKS